MDPKAYDQQLHLNTPIGMLTHHIRIYAYLLTIAVHKIFVVKKKSSFFLIEQILRKMWLFTYASVLIEISEG